MISLGGVIAKMQEEGINFDTLPKKPSRNDLTKQIYNIYIKSKKKTDVANYKSWLRRNGRRHSPELALHWRDKSGEWRKPISDKTFASFWLGHIPTRDMYYIVSVGNDMERRGQNFNRWFFWAIKAE